MSNNNKNKSTNELETTNQIGSSLQANVDTIVQYIAIRSDLKWPKGNNNDDQYNKRTIYGKLV